MRQLKSIRNHIIGRFTLDQLIVATVVAFIVGKLLEMSINYGVIELSIVGIMLFLLAVVLAIIYLIFFMKESILYNSMAMIQHWIRYVIGDTKVRKFDCTTSYLKKKIPITKYHENGMIEFPKKQFGVMLDLHMPIISETGHAMFLIKNTEILNSIPDGIMYKSMHFSHRNIKKPLIDQVKSAINRPDTTPEMKKHLYTSYEYLVEVPENVEWDGFGFIGVGKYKNADEAAKKSKVSVEVVINSLIAANIIPRRITDEYIIALAYRQFLSMKKVV